MSIYIHIGFRKTATSWLQKNLFPSLPINYIGKGNNNYPDWLINWHYADDFYFKSQRSEIIKMLERNLVGDRPNLISSEAFTNTSVIYSQAVRIKKISPQAKIIITLRDPVDMVWSHYTHDILEGDCFVDIDNWLDWGRTPFVLHKRKTIYIPDFFFDETIKHYIELFGQENVCVLKMEDMSNEKNIFFEKLYQFLNIKAEPPIAALLATKVNKSNDVVPNASEMKWNNFMIKLQSSYPILHEELARAPFNKYSNKEVVMPENVKRKLELAFKGKTNGYY